ncbi:hypothetical protein NMY22_g11827 [Coprinellus aureogranulatus]|nr:hypothetical protein NMY22_g11827 [Coprinellus aureogranulatus]
MTSTLPPLIQALSGSVGSASASALTYPLDLITTRLQLDSSVKAKRRGGVYGGLRLLLRIVYGSRSRKWLKQWKETKARVEDGEEDEKDGMGWGALYDGLQSDLYATIISNFFYFYFYSFLRSLSTQGLNASITLAVLRRALKLPSLTSQSQPSSKKHKPTIWEDILLGFIAGVASRAVSTPLNIITLRLQEERADSEDDDSSSDGSLTPSPSESDSDGAISPLRASNPPLESVGLPTGLSTHSSHAAGERKGDMGILDVARLIYAERGLKGFWKGFTTSALLSINPSITLAVFQLFRQVIVYSRRRRNPLNKNTNLTPLQAFFVGAIANSIASTILYPLILAKKRLQSSSPQSRATLVGVLREAYLGAYNPHSPDPSSDAPFPGPSASTNTPDSTADHPPTLPHRPSYKRARSSRRSPRDLDGKMEGLEGLYQGWQMQILKGFLNQGVTFLVKGEDRASGSERVSRTNAEGEGLELRRSITLPFTRSSRTVTSIDTPNMTAHQVNVGQLNIANSSHGDVLSGKPRDVLYRHSAPGAGPGALHDSSERCDAPNRHSWNWLSRDLDGISLRLVLRADRFHFLGRCSNGSNRISLYMRRDLLDYSWNRVHNNVIFNHRDGHLFDWNRPLDNLLRLRRGLDIYGNLLDRVLYRGVHFFRLLLLPSLQRLLSL